MDSATRYWETHKLLENQPLEDGFYDPGRGGAGVHSSLPDLEQLRGARVDGVREVVRCRLTVFKAPTSSASATSTKVSALEATI